jgi:hypothetical protein
VIYNPTKNCGDMGCVNIAKKCTDNLKHYAFYWNTQAIGIYTAATNISLDYTLLVGGHALYSRPYGKTKNGNQAPLFHGSSGFGSNPWGKYSYTCWIFFSCTVYLNSTGKVAIAGAGTYDLYGNTYDWTLSGNWGKGTVVPWKGVLKWAGLDY